jgi:cobyrinic acid a,c-diamide synthase
LSARALVVAAPASGAGKTTVATGIMAALRRRGTAVAPFKVGPDYIDPGYHTLAAGRPGRNLDPVLVGADRIAPLARHGAADAEIAVVEGVMGLFDGRIADGCGSTAQVAALLGAPVVLVVDARGQGRSLAALLHGFRSFDPAPGGRVDLAGVVLNRVGSRRHEQVLRAAVEEVGLPVLGALPRRDALAVPSRHLGLITAAEHGGAAVEAVDAMAELVAGHVDLEAVLALARPLPHGPAWSAADALADHDTPWTAPTPDREAALAAVRPGAGGIRPGVDIPAARVDATRPAGVRVGMFGGAAFTFGYAELVELLTAAGAEVVVVDPLRDAALPAGLAALVLPGGFPEEHVGALAANAGLRAAVRELAASGAPLHAECGGLLYLCSTLDGVPMCDVLPAQAAMTQRLTLGYRDAVALTPSPLHPAGARVTGHEFHRCTVAPRAATPAWAWRGAEPEGYVHGGVHASFLHTHPAGSPGAVARFVAAAARGT